MIYTVNGQVTMCSSLSVDSQGTGHSLLPCGESMGTQTGEGGGTGKEKEGIEHNRHLLTN